MKLQNGMNAQPISTDGEPIRAPKGDYSDTLIYRLLWAMLDKRGKEVARPEIEAGLWRKVSSRNSPKGAVSAMGPDGTREGEQVYRQQCYQRWTAGELILRPLLPGVESPSGESGNPMEGE